jgi:hypothetical protein
VERTTASRTTIDTTLSAMILAHDVIRTDNLLTVKAAQTVAALDPAAIMYPETAKTLTVPPLKHKRRK